MSFLGIIKNGKRVKNNKVPASYPKIKANFTKNVETVGGSCQKSGGYTKGRLFLNSDGNLYRTTTDIAYGATLVNGTNCEPFDVDGVYSEVSEDNATVRYYNGEIQYTPDGGTTWVDLINTEIPQQLLPQMTSNSNDVGVASCDTGYASEFPPEKAYKVIDGSDPSYNCPLASTDKYVAFAFTTNTYVSEIRVKAKIPSGYNTSALTLDYSTDGVNWINGIEQSVTSTSYVVFTQNVNTVVKAVRVRKPINQSRTDVNALEAWA